MQKIRMLALGCGTLALALGAGHFMQAGTVADTPMAAAPLSERPARSVVMSAAPDQPSLMSPSAQPRAPRPELRHAALGVPAARTDALPAGSPATSPNCDYSLTADPAPGAMVSLALAAPCAPDARFTLHHNGMMFTAVTDAEGVAELQVPAFAESPVFIASFTNGQVATAKTRVENLGAYRRVAIQWQGDSGIRLHALDSGAEPGNDRQLGTDARGDNINAAHDPGFMTLLGDTAQPNALVAQIYTSARQPAGREDAVTLQVEAEVTEANCARDIEAQALQTSDGGALRVQDVTLMMPGCDAVGDFLVLKNLFDHTTIARN